MCKNSHWLYGCPSFRKLSIQERTREAKRLKACLNCLRLHPDRECTFGGCQRCRRRHNTLLHCDTNDNLRIKAAISEEAEGSHDKEINDSVLRASNTVTTSHGATKDTVHALLSTAIIFIRDNKGEYQECRALLDSASQSDFMTKNLCQRLQLKTCKTDHLINGFGQTNVLVNNSTSARIRSRYNNYQADMFCFIVDNITGMLPPDEVDTRQIIIPKYIILADPKYHMPSKIDLLIGVTLFYDLLQEQRMSLGHNQPILQETKLGWIIGGPFTPCKSLTRCSASRCFLSLNAQIREQLERFWKLEELEQSNPYTKEEQLCEDNFVSTHRRDQHGRFIVRLPLKDKSSSLGESKEIAERCLRSVEKKLERNSALKEAYNNFMQEYEELGHMSGGIYR